MMRSRHARIALALLSLVALASLAAGCGGSASPSVASLGTSGAGTTTSDGGTAAGPSTSSSSGGGAGASLKAADAAKFSSCMRSHGVPNFPDPGSGGGISVGPGSGIDPASPKFRAAQQACQNVLPNGGQPSPQQLAKMQQKLLAFSACMRSHGVPDFPDPSFSGGGAQLSLRGTPGSDLNPNSPRFQAAQTACQGNLPGKVSVATRSAGG
jgi:hypothetical protein